MYTIHLPASYASMPWRNGLGTTAQIAIHPPGAVFPAFDWRISSADVTASNPFSIFDGYDRILVLVASNSDCIISHPSEPGSPTALLVPFAPFRFSGSISTHCEDFNVIYKRATHSAELRVHHVTAASPLALSPPASASFYMIFCAAGDFTANQRDRLPLYASLCCAAPSPSLVLSLTGTGVVFEVIITNSPAPSL